MRAFVSLTKWPRANLNIVMRLLLLLIGFNLFSQQLIVTNDVTWYDSTLKGVINYSSIMFGEKIFVGVESGTWRDIDGILAHSSRVNENISIYSGIRFKDQIRGYFINVNYNTDRCLCRRQWPIKYYIGIKSLTLKDVRLSIGVRYKIF